jgi:chromosome segregation ATPase
MGALLQDAAAVVIILTGVGAFSAFAWRLFNRYRDEQRAEQEKTRAAIADLSTRIVRLEKAITEVDAQRPITEENIKLLHEVAKTVRDAVNSFMDSDERTRKELTALRELEDSTRWDMAVLKDNVNDQGKQLAEIETSAWTTPELPN